MEPTVQGIFRSAFPDYEATHSIPPHKRKAAHALMDCRTDVLGGHVRRCECGQVDGVWYNSCKHRACPQCGALPNARWLETQEARLLDCDHYHAVFTIPHELCPFWLLNVRLMGNLLFRSAVDTLMELLLDPRYLGARPGIIASLHTWGRSQSLHPHLHCLVTGGGWAEDGTWKPVENGYLLPFRLVATRFRIKMVQGLRKALEDGDLVLPPDVTLQQTHNLLNKLGYKTKWNVRIQERYPHGRGVAKYLARYLKGGPLRNGQILHADADRVDFRYKDHATGKYTTLPLSTDHFIQRLLWHIPEPGMHGVRHYGLYGHGKRALREQIRPLFGQSPVEDKPDFLDAETYLERIGRADLLVCPGCGKPVRIVMTLPRNFHPPPCSFARPTSPQRAVAGQPAIQ